MFKLSLVVFLWIIQDFLYIGSLHMPIDIVLPIFTNLDDFYSFVYFFKKIIGIQLTYNVVLLSGVQKNESVKHKHIPILFQIIFPYRSLQGIEYISLCYTVGPCYSFILYIAVCICQSQAPVLSLPPSVSPLVNISLVFEIFEFVSVL